MRLIVLRFVGIKVTVAVTIVDKSNKTGQIGCFNAHQVPCAPLVY